MQSTILRMTGVWCGLAACLAAAEPPQVKVVQIAENRVISNMPPNARPNVSMLRAMAGGGEGLQIVLELEGDAVESATHYGMLKVADLKSDDGKTLAPQPAIPGMDIADDYVEIDRSFQGDEPVRQLYVTLRFALPARTAKSLKSIEGSLELVGGPSEPVVIAGVAKKTGKLTEKPLVDAGLTATLVKPKPDDGLDPAKTVGIELQGDMTRLVAIWLESADGEEIDTFVSSSDDGKKTRIFLECEGKVPPTAGLGFEIVTKQEKTKVPFKFSDLKLR